MVLNVSTDTEQVRNVSAKVKRAQKRRMEDAMDRGFAEGISRTPVGATGSLQNSAYEPTWDGSRLHFGWQEDYAADVNDGQPPHLIPESEMPDLKLWAKRVLGSEEAAYPVWRKIAREGTEPQRFADAARASAERYYVGHELGDYLDREL